MKLRLEIERHNEALPGIGDLSIVWQLLRRMRSFTRLPPYGAPYRSSNDGDRYRRRREEVRCLRTTYGVSLPRPLCRRFEQIGVFPREHANRVRFTHATRDIARTVSRGRVQPHRGHSQRGKKNKAGVIIE